MIVCFDIRSEVFRYINIEEGAIRIMNSSCTLINYEGKLGALELTFSSPKRLEVWVLEESETWSKTMYGFPDDWREFVEQTELTIVGMAGRDEVVLAPIYYFKFKRCSFTRVEIQGFGEFTHKKVDIHLDYIENWKRL